MKRVMHRLFWAWDFDREEDWLNAWAARGLALVDVCGIRYVFEEGAPGEYEYRLELLEHTAGSSEGRFAVMCQVRHVTSPPKGS